MRFDRRVGLIGAMAAFACVGGGGVRAAEDRTAGLRAQSGVSAPTIQVYSRETVVDVTVTDKDGKPVRGLTRDDFTISEDGKAQSIRSFKEFDKVGQDASAAPRELPANTYTNVQSESGPLYVLLLDDVNGGGVRARLAAMQYMKSVAPGTRVALIEFASRLTVQQGPTTEPALRPGTVLGSNPINIPPVTGCVRQVLLDWKTLDLLNQLASYLSGIPGKKNLIWLGNGIPDMVWNGCQDWRLPLQQTYDLLENAQVTVYPVDPIGIRAPLAPALTGSPSSYGEQAATQNTDWLAGLAKNHLSMEAVAESTGGQAFYNTNDIAGAIAKAADVGASYYTLSYVPPSVGYDGRYHAISVKVDRPGIHLLYRKGYSDEDPALIEHPPEKLFGFVTRDTRPTFPTADPLAAAMSPTSPPATKILFDVRVEPSTEPVRPTDPEVIGFLEEKLKKEPLTRYEFLYTVPVDQIAFADEPEAVHRGALEFVVVAFDQTGKQVTMAGQTMRMPLSGDEYQQFVQQPFQFMQQIDLPPGAMTVRVGVLDKLSNKVGTVEVPLTVAKGATALKAGK
jgi:VWFA-related protein